MKRAANPALSALQAGEQQCQLHAECQRRWSGCGAQRGQAAVSLQESSSWKSFMDIYFTGDLRNIKLEQSAVSKEINDWCEAR